jgi:general secretion pathway protein N
MALPRRGDRSARNALSGTRSTRPLIALGIVALLAFAVATLPSSLLAGRLQRHGLTAVAFTGSIWSGVATGLAWRGAVLGDLRWRIAPLQLLRGRLGAHVLLTRADGRVESNVAATLAGDLHLEDTSLTLPVEALGVLPVGLPKGWRGHIRAEFAELELAKGWPVGVRGTIDMDGLVAPPPRNASIGSYHAVLPDPKSQAKPGADISARVTDKEGPFEVDGRLTLAPDRSFLLDGTLAPRGDTPPALRRSLELLGPADAAGRRPFGVSGTI